MHRNEELFRLFHDWLRDALVWLQQPHVYTKANDEMARLGLDATGVSSCRFSLVQQFDELLELSATKALFACLVTVPEAVNILIEPEHGVQRPTEAWMLRSIAIRFLNVYLDRTMGLAFRPDEVGGLYAELEQLLYDSETIEIIGMVEFENAKFEIDDAEIAPGVRFRRVAETEISRGNWFISGEPFRQLPEVVLEVKTKFASEDATIDSPLSSENRQLIEDAADAVLLALRLVRPHPICVYAHRFNINNAFLDHVESSMVFEYGSCGLPTDRSVITSPGHVSPNLPGDRYVVASDVVEEVRNRWPSTKNAIRAIGSDHEWSLAVTRFSDAYRRSKRDDQLIDYWIALEALFLPKDRVPEMGVAAGLAISHYLGETPQKRRSLFEFVKTSHTLRSEVVHGKTGKRDQQFDSKVKKTRDLLRRSMLKRIGEF
jgi:hypothetical protein